MWKYIRVAVCIVGICAGVLTDSRRDHLATTLTNVLLASIPPALSTFIFLLILRFIWRFLNWPFRNVKALWTESVFPIRPQIVPALHFFFLFWLCGSVGFALGTFPRYQSVSPESIAGVVAFGVFQIVRYRIWGIQSAEDHV
jgi:hypothetical protein